MMELMDFHSFPLKRQSQISWFVHKHFLNPFLYESLLGTKQQQLFESRKKPKGIWEGKVYPEQIYMIIKHIVLLSEKSKRKVIADFAAFD